MTATLTRVVRESPAYRVMEFERRFREAAAAGRSPDALDKYNPDEVERFWARTIPGLDGHVYWDGPKHFTRNDGKKRRPARWVRERTLRHALPGTTDVWSTCGETNCISPGHLTSGRNESRKLYADDRIIGAAQVAAMRLGYAPSPAWWDAEKMRPLRSVIVKRWGSWQKFLIACGLDPSNIRPAQYQVCTREQVLSAVQALAQHLGHAPEYRDWARHREWLRANGHPTSPNTVKKYLGDGSYVRAMKAVGLR